MTQENNTNDNGITADLGTYYDFIKRWPFVSFIGTYRFYTKPLSLFILNIIYIIFKTTLFASAIIAGLCTLYIVSYSKFLFLQALYTLGYIIISVLFIIIRAYLRKDVMTAIKLVRKGIYQYDELNEEYIEIKKKRLARTELFLSILSKGMYSTGIIHTFVPFLHYVFAGDEENDGTGLHLPLHFYLPFDTRTLFGSVVGYLLNALVIIIMYITYISHFQIHYSGSLMLACEFEVLNHSLRNIEKRAFLKMKTMNNVKVDNTASIENWYDVPEFQEALYLCLKDNIRHHHEILRFRKYIGNYIESSTTVGAVFFSVLMAMAILILLDNTRPQIALITDLFSFYPMCWMGQNIANQSDDTKDAVYATPWVYAEKRFTVPLNILLSNTQKPVMLRTKGFRVNLCVETFADLVSFGYKVLNIIR